MRTAAFMAVSFLALGVALSAVPGRAAQPPAAAPSAHSKCLTHTGSRIPPKQGQCLGGPGSVYSQEDVQRTGATSAGGALRLLSPVWH